MALAAFVLEVDANDVERLSDALLAAGVLSVDLQDAWAGTPKEKAVFDEPGEGRGWKRVKLTALLPAEIKDNAVIYPPADSLAKLEYAVNATYNSPERAEAWARIKASA